MPLLAVAQQSGGTLMMTVEPEPPSLASYISTSQPIGQVATKVYDVPLSYDSDTMAQPALAELWEVSEDGTSIIFNLRQGVTWHDGEPFTSADIQFTLMEVLKKFHPRGSDNFSMLNAVETPDEHTAIFRLDGPAPYILRILSAYESPVVPKHAFGAQDVREYDKANEPIGTGPFKFVEWRRGQFMRFDRNEDYWKEGLPCLDRIVARFIPDPGTQIKQGTVFVNASRWSSPETDRIMDKAAVELDVDARKALYDEMQPLVVDAAPHVFVREPAQISVYNTKVKGLLDSPFGSFWGMDTVWIEQ